MNEPVAVAVLAKAPIAGFAKTRLIPVLGARGAAVLQGRLIERAVETACAAAVGPVTLWTTPDESHPTFQSIATRLRIALEPCYPWLDRPYGINTASLKQSELIWIRSWNDGRVATG